MSKSLSYLFNVVPTEPYSLIIDNIQKIKLQEKLIPKAQQLLVNKEHVQLIKQISDKHKVKLTVYDTFDSGLSQLNNDDLAIIFANRKFNNLITTAQKAARYSSNVHVQTCQQALMTLPKGVTEFKFPKTAKLTLVPVHGKCSVKVNGVENLIDFGGEIAEFSGEKLVVDAEMPVLAVVEGKCDNCEGK